MILVFSALVTFCIFQAWLSSLVNHGKIHWSLLIVTGLVAGLLWALMSKYSTNMVRDNLIWDVVTAMVFTLVFVLLGHSSEFTFKHWFGIAMTIMVFIYWSVI